MSQFSKEDVEKQKQQEHPNKRCRHEEVDIKITDTTTRKRQRKPDANDGQPGPQASELSPFVSHLIDQAISVYNIPLAKCRVPL